MIRQIAHVCFFTDQLDKMIDFYAGKLGLKVQFTLADDEDRPFGYYFDCGHSTFLEIFDYSLAIKQWGGERQDLKKRSRYQHLCFEVTGLETLCRKLRETGIPATEIATGMDYSRQAWIKDPDGNAIELMEYTEESLQLKGKETVAGIEV